MTDPAARRFEGEMVLITGTAGRIYTMDDGSMA